MSTGDQSQYVRAKMAERGSNSQAKFMMDGFDRWAESTAPAREGQMEKMPAESQMANYGGAMTLSKAKQKLHRLEGIHELEGGVDVIPQAVKDAANYAKQMIQVWDGISARIDSFLEELQDQVIDDPKSSASLVSFAKTLQAWFNKIKFLKDILDGASQLAKSVGLGKKRKHSVKLRGGASLSWSDLAGYAKQITELYMWLKQNAKNMRTILNMKSLQPEGGQILNVVDPILKAIGMGRPSGGRSASSRCECDDMNGGFNPVGDMMRLAGNPGYGQKTTHEGIAYGEKIGVHPGIKRPMGGRSRSARKVAIMEGPYYGEASYGGASCGGRKPSARGAVVRKIMHEMGLSLPQASKYVKDNGLY